MYLSSYHDICDIYHQNSMTEINSFDIYSWHKQLTYDTCQEIILPTTWKNHLVVERHLKLYFWMIWRHIKTAPFQTRKI